MAKKNILNAKKLEKQVLSKINPGKDSIKKEEIVLKEIFKKLEKITPKYIKIGIFGSFARKTHLKSNTDIDVFLLFKKNTSLKKFESTALSIGKKFFGKGNWYLEYSEHPYVKGNFKGYTVEIVPGYDLVNSSKLLSAVDRTPLHHKYLKKKLTPEMRNQVRLLKSFLKGIYCYGAKVSVSGFSGYLTELLILKHKTFQNLVQAVSKWKDCTLVEIELGDKKYSSKFDYHLVVIDPTDKKRNTAASVSFEQYNRFILACRAYLENPNKEYFHVFRKTKTSTQLKKEFAKRNFVIVEMPFPGIGLVDIVGAQQRKVHSKILNSLWDNYFPYRKSTFYQGKEKLYHSFEFYEKKGPETQFKLGPLLHDKTNCKAFLDKHKSAEFGPWTIGERIGIEVKTKETNLEKFIISSIKKIAKQEKQPISIALKKAKIVKATNLLKKTKDKELMEFLQKSVMQKEFFL